MNEVKGQGHSWWLQTKHVNGTPTSGIIQVTTLYIHPTPMVTKRSVPWPRMDVLYPLLSPVNQPSNSWDQVISDFDLETTRPSSWVWSNRMVIQWAQYHNNLLHFGSRKSDQQFLRYSYCEIWPWKIQGQGHGWGQRSRSCSSPSIQPVHFFFIPCQSDQPFLRYGQ